MEKLLTIILPIKDRISYTLRWMEYADKCQFPYKILIADGGKENNLNTRLTQKRYPNLDFEYLRYPYDGSYHDYFSKMSDALSRVSTPYAMFADDDDFFIKKGIDTSLEFLQKNEDYVACRGRMGNFYIESINPSKKKAVFSSGTISPTINDEKALERVQRHFSSYRPTFYEVHRIEILKKSFQTLHKLGLNDLFLAELLTSFMTVASGKVKRSSELYLLRQSDSQGSSASSNNKGGPLGRMLQDTWSRDFYAFISTISEIISNNDDTPLNKNLVNIKELYLEYLTAAIKRKVLPSTIGYKLRTKYCIKNALRVLDRNYLLFQFFRNIYQKLWLKEDYLLNSSKSKYVKELNIIRHIIQESE